MARQDDARYRTRHPARTFVVWVPAHPEGMKCMYRTKGAVRIEGMDGPVIVNGVQHVSQPPQRMPGITVDRSRLLFITADLDRAAIETSLRDDLPQFLRLSRERAERAARAAADPSIPV